MTHARRRRTRRYCGNNGVRAPYEVERHSDPVPRSAGLPPALSGDRTYFLWGPRGYSGDCMIVLDDKKEVLERYWENVEYVGSSAPNPWALEAEIPVFICRTKKFASLGEVWPGLKRWR